MTQASRKSIERSEMGIAPNLNCVLLGFRRPAVPDRDAIGWESMVRIIHGVHDLKLPVAGKTVGEVRADLMFLLNFRHDAHALIRGDRANEFHVLTSEQTLEFLAPIGYKGVGRIWSREEFCESFRLTSDQFQEWKNQGLPIHAFADGEEKITETDFDLWSSSKNNGASSNPSGIGSLLTRSSSDRPATGKKSRTIPRQPDFYGRMTDEVVSVIHSLLAMTQRCDDIIEIMKRFHDQQSEIIAMVKGVQEVILTQQTLKDWYSVAEMADRLGKKPYTVREWLRLGRIKGEKKACGRGRSKDWMISHEELARYQNEGLLPLS